MDNTILIKAVYFVSVILFIMSIKQMSLPKTAKKGIRMGGLAMLASVLITFLYPEFKNYLLILVAIGLGSLVAYISAKKVAITDMPQMIAIYNGMGGGSAAGIALIGIYQSHNLGMSILGVVGAVIGGISFAGSCVAYAKLQGLINKNYSLPFQNVVNIVLFLGVIYLGYQVSYSSDPYLLMAFIGLILVLGVMTCLPIGGADMPVVISLYNAFTGIAVSLEGLHLQNEIMIVAGIIVGASGTLLTILMAKAMNRPIKNILFSSFVSSSSDGSQEVTGVMKESSSNDVASLLAYANNIVIVPGYGLAVSQAQFKLNEVCKFIENNFDGEVKYAIHPVAGRMPGHMNVLLAEAGVDYEKIFDLDEINEEFDNTDVVIVIGANDVVNPSAIEDKNSPIYGMPILKAYAAKNVIVLKRGKGTGFSGLVNPLFYKDNVRLFYGDATKSLNQLVSDLKILA